MTGHTSSTDKFPVVKAVNCNPDDRTTPPPLPAAAENDRPASTTPSATSSESSQSRSSGRLVLASAGTHPGRVRRNNEDVFLLLPQHQLYVVADGMGGRRAGEVASRLAVDMVQEVFTRGLEAMNGKGGPSGGPARCGRLLVEAFKQAHRVVLDEAAANPAWHGMGCTMVAACVDGDLLHIVHAGDSRCYRLRGGKLKCLTRDHTPAEHPHLLPARLRKAKLPPRILRNAVLRAVGMPGVKELEVDHAVESIATGDRFLLCSDGLNDELSDEEIRSVLEEETWPSKARRKLIESALRRGGKDNVTALVLAFLPDSSAEK